MVLCFNSQLGQLYCEVKYAPFACPRQRRPHAPDQEERALSVALRQALEPAVCRHLFPNYQVYLVSSELAKQTVILKFSLPKMNLLAMGKTPLKTFKTPSFLNKMHQIITCQK